MIPGSLAKVPSKSGECKNSRWIDVGGGFIRIYAVAPDTIHDSRMLTRLLDPENEHFLAGLIRSIQAMVQVLIESR